MQDAAQALTDWAYCDAHDLDHRDDNLRLGLEATVRAISSVSLAIERLAELVIDD